MEIGKIVEIDILSRVAPFNLVRIQPHLFLCVIVFCLHSDQYEG